MSMFEKICHLISRHFGCSSLQHPEPPSFLTREDLSQFLPTYLSEGSKDVFIDEIKHFLAQTTRPFYSAALGAMPILFQGDGILGLPIIRLPQTRIESGRAILLSNTCDVDPRNRRLFDACLTYAPILSLNKYLDLLRREYPVERVDAHERDIRQQLITQILFLPRGGRLDEDCLVFLDRINSSSSNIVSYETLPRDRLFTLSDFGAWLLALKLSIHFCRVRDQVDRNAGRF